MELLLILLQIITYSTFQCDSVFDMRLLLSLNYYKVFYRKSIEKYLKEKELNLTATLDAKAAYTDADFVVIAASTNVYGANRSNVA